MDDILYVVIPCYNEEDVLPETSRRIGEKIKALIASGKISASSRAVFVNDGSSDKTWDMICALHKDDKLFSGINLSRNRGHQNALLAGLMTVRGKADAVISMDADLQDDIDAIDEMLEKYYEGCDIVYGVRSRREKDSFLKRFTAEGYYKFLDFMGCDVTFNHADYRLMSNRALEGLASFKECNLFLRGIVPMIGYKSDVVTYARSERYAGESKYTLKKMLSLAADGISSLSIKPIRFITAIGAIMLFLAFALLVFSLVRLIGGYSMLNWKIITISLWAVGGLILIAIGIVGEYIGKTYMEVKNRPRFIIESMEHEDS